MDMGPWHVDTGPCHVDMGHGMWTRAMASGYIQRKLCVTNQWPWPGTQGPERVSWPYFSRRWPVGDPEAPSQGTGGSGAGRWKGVDGGAGGQKDGKGGREGRAV